MKKQLYLSFIIILRNRVNNRLYNCLTSMHNQKIDPSLIEIILVDYGSDEKKQKYIRGIAKHFNARYEYVDEKGPWNRARAINLGCQKACAPILATSDIDMIFEPNYATTAIECFESCNQGPFYARAIPYNSPEREFSEQEITNCYRKIFDASVARPTGKGNVIFSRSLFEDLRGWEEEYEVHGCEDDDFYIRAKRSNALCFDLTNRTSLIHQWHAPTVVDPQTRRRFGSNLAMYHSTSQKTPIIRTGAFGIHNALAIHKHFMIPSVTIVILPHNDFEGLSKTLFSIKESMHEKIEVALVNYPGSISTIEHEIEFPVYNIESVNDESMQKKLKNVSSDIIGFVNSGTIFSEHTLREKILVPLLSGTTDEALSFFWLNSKKYNENHQIVS